MTARLSTLLALCLGLPGCVEHRLVHTTRFVDAPADTDCRALWKAVEARGWSAELQDRSHSVTVITAEETWVLSGGVEQTLERTYLPLATAQPRAWRAVLFCAPDYEREELAVRACRVAGRSFGVVDPRQSTAIRGALAADRYHCTLEVVAELRRDEASSSSMAPLRRSLRPLLEEPR